MFRVLATLFTLTLMLGCSSEAERSSASAHVAPVWEGGADWLGTEGSRFALHDRICSTAVFHWFSEDHHVMGPWIPLEGREAWNDGDVEWWKGQIKQMMMANFDLLYVHLIDFLEDRRINFFQALYELRREGYDVPRVAPFLDPTIIYNDEDMVDLSTEEGVDDLVSHYIRWYEQYFEQNPDPQAIEYIGVIDDRVALNIWHMHVNCAHVHALTREDVESRLAARFGEEFPVFNNGVYLSTCALSLQVPTWQDEKIAQFEIVENFRFIDHRGIVTYKVCPGNWDQNIRNPGNFNPRNGGDNFREAWRHPHGNLVHRVYVESFNEYDEGSGIFAAKTDEIHREPRNTSGNTDVWSNDNDPYEYIEQTAENLARLNMHPEHDARVLTHALPERMVTGSTVSGTVTMRNDGDARWTGATHGLAIISASMGQQIAALVDPVGHPRDEIETYRGIFRGRPVTFDITLRAPNEPGEYVTRWQMFTAEGNPFGQTLEHTIIVENQ